MDIPLRGLPEVAASYLVAHVSSRTQMTSCPLLSKSDRCWAADQPRVVHIFLILFHSERVTEHSATFCSPVCCFWPCPMESLKIPVRNQAGACWFLLKAVFQKWLTKGSSGKAAIVLNVPALEKAGYFSKSMFKKIHTSWVLSVIFLWKHKPGRCVKHPRIAENRFYEALSERVGTDTLNILPKKCNIFCGFPAIQKMT